MRGENESTQAMFSYVSPEAMAPKDHPLRPIKAMVDAALKQLSVQFDAIYSHTGRPSIPPEKLLKASLLQAFYTIRSERQLVEQIGYNILFRWFLDMALDEKPWDATVFTKNRDRLLKAEISAYFFSAVLAQAGRRPLAAGGGGEQSLPLYLMTVSRGRRNERALGPGLRPNRKRTAGTSASRL
jgi:transposase